MTPRVALVLVGALLVGRAAAADAPDAERLYTEGQTAYDDKRYDDAITAWQKSYDLSHLPALVFNLAQAQRLAGHCTKAVDSYQAFIKLDPASPQRADAESRLKEIQPCADLPVAPPTRVGPPPVTPVVQAPPGNGKHVASLVLAGAGVGLIVVGAVFGSQASSLATDVHDACTPHCDWTADLQAKESTGQRDTTLQYVMVGAGAAALITSGILWRLGSREHHVPVAVTPRADGAALSWSGTW